jgi:hypothetical protein
MANLDLWLLSLVLLLDTTNLRKSKIEGKSKVMYTTRETNVLKEKIKIVIL